jgi:hypothetical protein
MKKILVVLFVLILTVYLKPNIQLPDGSTKFEAVDSEKVFAPTRFIFTLKDGTEISIRADDILYIIKFPVKENR